MVVRFDAKSLLEARAPTSSSSESHYNPAPENLIGVEGDPPTKIKGAISEIERTIRKAQSMLDNHAAEQGKDRDGTGGDIEGRKDSLLGIGEDAIREEEGKESGPELVAPPEKHLKGKGGK